MLRLSLVCLALSALPVAAQEYVVGGYAAFIGQEDLFNSRGARLTDAASVLRQDRANVHRFGIVHVGDQGDPWFFQPAAREAMARMLANGGGIHPQVARMIVAGGVPVYVTVFAVNGNFTSLRVDIPG